MADQTHSSLMFVAARRLLKKRNHDLIVARVVDVTIIDVKRNAEELETGWVLLCLLYIEADPLRTLALVGLPFLPLHLGDCLRLRDQEACGFRLHFEFHGSLEFFLSPRSLLLEVEVLDGA